MGVQVFNITKKIVARVQGDLADQGAKDLRVLIREAYQERFKGKLTEAWQKLQDGKIDKFTKDGREVVFELADASQKHSGWAWPKKVFFQCMAFVKLKLGTFFKKSLNLKQTGVAMKKMAQEAESAKKFELEDLRKTVTRERDDIAYKSFLEQEKIIEGHVETILDQEKLIEEARKIEKTLVTKAIETDNLLTIEREKLPDLQKTLEEKTSTLMDPKMVEEEMNNLRIKMNGLLRPLETDNRILKGEIVKMHQTIEEMSQKVQQADQIKGEVSKLENQLREANQKLRNEQLTKAEPGSKVVKDKLKEQERLIKQQEALVGDLKAQLRARADSLYELSETMEEQKVLIQAAQTVLKYGDSRQYAAMFLKENFKQSMVEEYKAMMKQHHHLRWFREGIQREFKLDSKTLDAEKMAYYKGQISDVLTEMQKQPQLKDVVHTASIGDLQKELSDWTVEGDPQRVINKMYQLSKEIYQYRHTLPEQSCIHWIQVAHYGEGIV